MIECNRGVMDVKSFLNLAVSLLQIAMEVRVRVCYNTVVLKIKKHQQPVRRPFFIWMGAIEEIV